MYQPAFTETFVALIVVLLWARWLDGRAPAWSGWIPWAAGAGVIVSQGTAALVLARRGDVASQVLFAGRWIGMGSCLAALVVLAGLTLASFSRGRST